MKVRVIQPALHETRYPVALIFSTISFSLAALPMPKAAIQTNKGACIQPYSQGDVDCGEITDKNFRSIGSDPHRLDRDKDGIVCESR